MHNPRLRDPQSLYALEKATTTPGRGRELPHALMPVSHRVLGGFWQNDAIGEGEKGCEVAQSATKSYDGASWADEPSMTVPGLRILPSVDVGTTIPNQMGQTGQNHGWRRPATDPVRNQMPMIGDAAEEARGRDWSSAMLGPVENKVRLQRVPGYCRRHAVPLLADVPYGPVLHVCTPRSLDNVDRTRGSTGPVEAAARIPDHDATQDPNLPLTEGLRAKRGHQLHRSHRGLGEMTPLHDRPGSDVMTAWLRTVLYQVGVRVCDMSNARAVVAGPPGVMESSSVPPAFPGGTCAVEIGQATGDRYRIVSQCHGSSLESLRLGVVDACTHHHLPTL
nr:hypothetical protein CFP56_20996 [Quercus suber]